MPHSTLPDGTLRPWRELEPTLPARSLLLGNGASRAIWEGFAYTSLLEEARTNEALSASALNLFVGLDTANFESVLSTLQYALIANAALSLPTRPVEDIRNEVQTSLVRAIHGRHIQWSGALRPQLTAMRTEFGRHHTVFTTNYDLLSYWAIGLDGDFAGFHDHFSRGAFSTDCFANTCLLFLHGGLHLVRATDGEARKRAAGVMSLLDTFQLPFQDGSTPLFISEGTSAAKLQAIRRCDYLSYALERLGRIAEPLVIFGHSLNPAFDQHVVDQLKRSPTTRLVIGMLPATPDALAAAQHELYARLGNKQLDFFDATTHPLGAPSMKA